MKKTKINYHETDQAIARLAAMPLVDYDRCRDAEAKALGIRTSTLDEAVKTKRPKRLRNAEQLQGDELNLADPEYWPEPINGAEVLSEASETFSRYLALPDGAADAMALWTAHTHCFDCFQCSPRLNLSSPEKRCGKTTARDVISHLVLRALPTENMSVAVLFRVIQKHSPTLLTDECDAWLRENDELRGLFNAGHRRGGQVLRCEGDSHEIRAFNVFAPAALCGIGALPGTLHDRSIVIPLKRAKPGEIHERFDSRHVEREILTCRKLATFCSDNRDELAACDPALPPDAFNRLADNWRPLFAIAEIAGGDWPQRAAVAFTKLTSQEDTDAQGMGVMLLADIRQVFAENSTNRIFSKKLVTSLCTMLGRPWPEAHRGRPISETWLARRLHGFGISPQTLRIGDGRAKGYDLDDFAEAFERYLPPEG